AIAVDVWGPLILVDLRGLQLEDGRLPIEGHAANGPLHDYLAPLPMETAGLGLESLRFVERRQYELNCNWKVFVDNYLDGGYHVNTVHPGLAGVLDYAHYHTHIAGYTSVQTSPLRSAGHSAAGPTGQVRKGDNANYWWVFPNLMLN